MFWYQFDKIIKSFITRCGWTSPKIYQQAKEISELYQLLSTGVLLERKINNRGLFINARDLTDVNYFRQKLVHISLLSISKIFLHHIYLTISVDLHNLWITLVTLKNNPHTLNAQHVWKLCGPNIPNYNDLTR